MKRFGVIGASGIVGNELVNLLLNKYKLKSRDVLKFASKGYPKVNIQAFNFNNNELNDVNILFTSVNKNFSNKYIPLILEKYKNIKIIDLSSAFRYDDNVKLVIPEINGTTIKKDDRLIANPNCTTAISILALHPINELFKIKKIIMSTYQASSGAGKQGMDELINETNNFYKNKKINNYVFQHPLPFNIIPHIDNFHDNGYSNEEMKVVKETKKILNNDNIEISCTAVRIPILRSHSMSITIETEKNINYDELKEYYKKFNDVITVEDDINNNKYPMPINTSNKNKIQVGRIRPSLIFKEKGCELFVCGDQLLRGAALNAVLISDYM